jgi:hypothetical protein
MNLAGGDVRAALDVCQRAHGDAFVFGFGPIRFHWLLDRDGIHFVLSEAAEHFGNAGAYPFLTPVGGPTARIATDTRIASSWLVACENRVRRITSRVMRVVRKSASTTALCPASAGNSSARLAAMASRIRPM